MGTGISWTDETWVPLTGCTRVSAGCDHCYAFALHDRRHIAWKRGRWPDAPAQYHQPFSRVQMLPERLTEPLRWRRPRRVFLTSMGDLFHDDVPDEYLAKLWAVMALAPRHTFQVLTKRPERMAALLTTRRFWEMVTASAPEVGGSPCADGAVEDQLVGTLERGYALPNVHLGTSIENQDAEERIPWLLRTPAAVRFLSVEPMLGPVELDPLWLGWRRMGYDHGRGRALIQHYREPLAFDRTKPPMIDWLIAGGESGPRARPLHPDWVRSLRDQCVAAGVPFHFKQWGAWGPVPEPVAVRIDGETVLGMARVGVKRAGRELDGRTWDEFPNPVAVEA